MEDKANILVVDDLPEKLLVFSSILEEVGQNLVTVRSGSDALREVLAREFAVILLDVNMRTSTAWRPRSSSGNTRNRRTRRSFSSRPMPTRCRRRRAIRSA